MFPSLSPKTYFQMTLPNSNSKIQMSNAKFQIQIWQKGLRGYVVPRCSLLFPAVRCCASRFPSQFPIKVPFTFPFKTPFNIPFIIPSRFHQNVLDKFPSTFPSKCPWRFPCTHCLQHFLQNSHQHSLQTSLHNSLQSSLHNSLQTFPSNVPFQSFLQKVPGNSLQQFLGHSPWPLVTPPGPSKVPFKSFLQTFPSEFPFNSSLLKFPLTVPLNSSLQNFLQSGQGGDKRPSSSTQR